MDTTVDNDFENILLKQTQIEDSDTKIERVEPLLFVRQMRKVPSSCRIKMTSMLFQ